MRFTVYRLEGRTQRLGVQRVGAEQREVTLLLERAQGLDAVVELVVAEGGGVVAHVVDGDGHGVHGGALALGGDDGVHTGVVVRQRGALDDVAGVDEQDVVLALGGALLLDEGGDAGDATELPLLSL